MSPHCLSRTTIILITQKLLLYPSTITFLFDGPLSHSFPSSGEQLFLNSLGNWRRHGEAGAEISESWEPLVSDCSMTALWAVEQGTLCCWWMGTNRKCMPYSLPTVGWLLPPQPLLELLTRPNHSHVVLHSQALNYDIKESFLLHQHASFSFSDFDVRQKWIPKILE